MPVTRYGTIRGLTVCAEFVPHGDAQLSTANFSQASFIQSGHDLVDGLSNRVEISPPIATNVILALCDFVTVPVRAFQTAGWFRRQDGQDPVVIVKHRSWDSPFRSRNKHGSRSCTRPAHADRASAVLREVEAADGILRVEVIAHLDVCAAVAKASIPILGDADGADRPELPKHRC